MLNDLLTQIRQYQMLSPGDTLICAVSGGADSMALLWGMYLLREKLEIDLRAAHFNHRLRGEESDGEEAFVSEFCQSYGIPLSVGRTQVTAGKKGLEAAAREARYAFLRSLPGKIATAHTADDNVETVLMHLIRGSGLKGLGGITPVSGAVIRPMLNITRRQVEAFLNEYSIPHREDSSNESDVFLRNRIRHHVMPLLQAENPKLAENVSAMAQRLRTDAQLLDEMAQFDVLPPVPQLRTLPQSIRHRMLERFLKENGAPEPEAQHILQADALVFSEKPSARAAFPLGIVLERQYDRLTMAQKPVTWEPVLLPACGEVTVPSLGLRVITEPADQPETSGTQFTVVPTGQMVLRCRQTGDAIRLPGGTKSLKKLFADRKIPASQRACIPVVADDVGILGVYTVGADRNRMPKKGPAVRIRFEISTQRERNTGGNSNGKGY